MRITYQNGKLYLSLTRKEVEEVNESIGTPIPIDIGYLKVLHEDISKAVLQHWTKVEVVREVMRLTPTKKKEKAYAKKT